VRQDDLRDGPRIARLVALGAASSLGLGAAILGAILVHVASVLDGVDGEITRLQVRASSWAPCSTSCSTGSPTRR
jgi:hypothetical protein